MGKSIITIFFPEENVAHGVAYGPKGVSFRRLYVREFILDWCPLEFSLRDGIATDYQANNLGWHICSPKLKTCVESLCLSGETIQWLPIGLNIDGIIVQYHVLHLFQTSNVLSAQFTIFSDDHLVKPVIDDSAVGDLNVFAVPGDSVRVYLSYAAKRKIESIHPTGLKFLKVATVEQ